MEELYIYKIVEEYFFNKKDDDDGVMVKIWMGPVAPTSPMLLFAIQRELSLLSSLLSIIYISIYYILL